jgi:hypothetical protein
MPSIPREMLSKLLRVMESLTSEELQRPEIAAYYGVFLVRARANAKAARFLELADKATLLAEEKALVEAAKKQLQGRCVRTSERPSDSIDPLNIPNNAKSKSSKIRSSLHGQRNAVRGHTALPKHCMQNLEAPHFSVF